MFLKINYFKHLGNIFLFITMILIGFIIYDVLSFNQRIRNKLLGSKIEPVLNQNLLIEQIKPYDMYAQGLRGRNLFTHQKQAQLQVLNGQLPANLKVVGIMIGQESQVVLEDINNHQIYFIDEHSSGENKLLSVLDNQVLIRYQGQQIKIPLKGDK